MDGRCGWAIASAGHAGRIQRTISTGSTARVTAAPDNDQLGRRLGGSRWLHRIHVNDRIKRLVRNRVITGFHPRRRRSSRSNCCFILVAWATQGRGNSSTVQSTNVLECHHVRARGTTCQGARQGYARARDRAEARSSRQAGAPHRHHDRACDPRKAGHAGVALPAFARGSDAGVCIKPDRTVCRRKP